MKQISKHQQIKNFFKSTKGQFHIYATIILFLGLLFAPVFIYIIPSQRNAIDTSENRTLAKKPELSIDNLSSFPKDYEEYYNDHLPFRELIRNTWTNLNFILLHDSTNNTVIAGKEDFSDSQYSWLFLTAEGLGDSIADVEGVSTYSSDEITKMVNNIKQNTDKLAEQSIKAYFLVLPNKANVYREYLPAFIHFYKEKSRTEEVIDAATKAGVKNLAYPKEDLLKAKETGTIYYRQDTHWNAVGAFIGFRKIMNLIDPSYDNFAYDSKYETRENFGDLVHATGIKNYLKDTVPSVEYLPEQKYTLQKDEELSKYNAVTVSTNDAAPIKKTIIIVGDSYKESLKKYFYKTYSKVIDLHRKDYSPKLIQKYSPDIILHENVERLSLALLSLKLY